MIADPIRDCQILWFARSHLHGIPAAFPRYSCGILTALKIKTHWCRHYHVFFWNTAKMPREYRGNVFIVPGMPQYCRSNAGHRNAAAFPREYRRNATGMPGMLQECREERRNTGNAVIVPGMPHECRECRQYCRGNAAALPGRSVPRTHIF